MCSIIGRTQGSWWLSIKEHHVAWPSIQIPGVSWINSYEVQRNAFLYYSCNQELMSGEAGCSLHRRFIELWAEESLTQASVQIPSLAHPLSPFKPRLTVCWEWDVQLLFLNNTYIFDCFEHPLSLMWGDWWAFLCTVTHSRKLSQGWDVSTLRFCMWALFHKTMALGRFVKYQMCDWQHPTFVLYNPCNCWF